MSFIAQLALVVLMIELFLVAISALLGLEVWRQRMWEVTGWRVSEPARWLLLVFALLAGTFLLLGVSRDWAAVVGGVLCALVSVVVLVRRQTAAMPGRGTFAYVVFLACGILVAVSAR